MTVRIGENHGVLVDRRYRGELRDSYERAAPQECCGLLLGVRRARGAVVRRVVETLNAFSMCGGFVIPDHELARARRVAASERLSILAVFHSHPEGARTLSHADRDALSHSEWPWVVLTQDGRTCEIRLTWYDLSQGTDELGDVRAT